MLVMLGSIVGQHKTGRSRSASLSQRKACCSSSIQCKTRRDTGAASVATCINSTTRLCHQVVSKFINHPINTFNVLGGIWDPTDNKFTLLPAIPDLDLALEACKAFPKESTTCIWFIQGHKVCNSRTRLQTVPML